MESAVNGHLTEEHLVSTLIKELRSHVSLTDGLEMLKNLRESTANRRKYLTETELKDLAGSSSDPGKFLKIASELKQSKFPASDSFLYFTKKLSRDENLKYFLSSLEKKARAQPSTQLPQNEVPTSHSSITSVDIPEVHNRLARAAEQVKVKYEMEEKSFTESNEKELINWGRERPYLSEDFAVVRSMPEDVPCLQLQEFAIIDDLLSCLMGVSGEYIIPNPVSSLEPRTFTLHEGLDRKIAELAKKILVVAGHYSLIVRFIAQNKQVSSGSRVNQALVVAMGDIIQEYKEFIARVDKEDRAKNLYLHDLHFYIQPAGDTLEKMASIAKAIHSCNARGGQTLSILYEFVVTSVSSTMKYDLCLYLITNAVIPYFESVQKWIFQGVIFDPFDEFMIVSNSRLGKGISMSPDDYWSKRYSIRKDHVPSFLKKVEGRILDCGKHLNVIQECGDGNTSFLTNEESLNFSFIDEKYIDTIDRAYRFTSKTLLRILLSDFKIMDQIKCVKRYLLINQGDFVLQVLDTCEKDFLKPITEVSPTRLSALLEMAVRIPSTNCDNFRDNIILSLKSLDLTYQICKILSIKTDEEQAFKFIEESNKDLSCLDGFCLDYECTWPVSLVFNQKVKLGYQILFRHLFYCKYIERLLAGVWIQDKLMRSKSPRQTVGYTKCFALRAKMIFYVQNLEYYMMEDAIEPNWIEFLEKVEKVENMDEFLRYHWLFIENSVKDCLLTNPVVLKIFRKLLVVCKEFAFFVNPVNGSGTIINENQSFSECINEFDKNFEMYSLSLLNAVQQITSADLSEKFVNIIYRQNCNFYFTDKMDKKSDTKSKE